MIKLLTIITAFILFLPSQGQNIRVHDPVIIKEDSLFYIFCTGWGISVYTSKDMQSWERQEPVFKTPPEWTLKAVKGFKGHMWAPDIVHYKNLYYLFYSVSAFGKNTSCIGVATNKTLNAKSPGYQWADKGMVIQSVPGRDMWNAIDPNIAFDEDSIPWLTFGSFWNGIKLVKMDSSLVSVAQPEEWYTIARRKRDFELSDTLPGNGAIEAPFIFRKNGYFYLFASIDYCCRGLNSNYKIITGRAKNITGPYYDKDSVKLELGGGTVIFTGKDEWAGVGHNAVFTHNNKDYLVCHGYNKKNNGRPELIIKEITWENNWPIIK